jgi:hypothetical protein
MPSAEQLWHEISERDVSDGTVAGLFVATYGRLAPGARTLVLEPGRAVVVGTDGLVGQDRTTDGAADALAGTEAPVTGR